MSNNVPNGLKDTEKCHFFRKEQADKLQKRFSFKGDVLLTHKGTVGNVAIVSNIPTAYIMLTPQVTYYRVRDRSKVNNIFIRFYFESAQFQAKLEHLSEGGTRAYIGITNQRKLPFVLPPFPEQRSIAQVLTDADALIAALDKLIAKKRHIKTGTMQQLLTGKKRLPGFGVRKGYQQSAIGLIPEDWDILLLRELTNFVGSGKSISNRSYGDYPLYGSTGVIGYNQTFEYEGDSILVARVGANAGKLNFVSGSYGVSDNTIIIKLKNGLDIHFFLYQLLHKDLNSLVFGSGQPLITGTQIKNLSIMHPTAPEQKAIAQVLSDIDAEITALETRRAKTQAIKQGMMQELLTGKTRLVGSHTA